jgi:hypothetical protein
MTQLLPSLGVSFPLTPLRQSSIPLEVEIRQNEFMHDMAVVRFSGVSPGSPALRSGNPVRITYGYRGQQLAEFCGYSLWAKTRRGTGRDRHAYFTDMVCQGASRNMQGANHRVHTNLTVNQVIRQVGREYKFDILRDNLTEKWGRLTNAGHSDFTHLMKVAKRKGHIFYVHNATLCMYDPIDYIVKHRGSWPILVHRPGQQIGDIISYDGNLSDDGGSLSATMPIGIQYVGYVDPITGAPTMQANTGDCSPHGDDVFITPPADVWTNDEPVEDGTEASMVTEGAALNNRWRHEMKVTCYGNQRIHQGTGVVLDGVADNVNGLWYVKSVKHILARTSHPGQFTYRMDLALLRDSRSLKTVTIPSGPVARKEAPSTGLTVGLAAVLGFDTQKTGPVLRNGLWVSNHPLREVAA